jgi:hypothetical protein
LEDWIIADEEENSFCVEKLNADHQEPKEAIWNVWAVVFEKLHRCGFVLHRFQVLKRLR